MNMDLRSIAKLGVTVLLLLTGCEEPFDKAAALRTAQKATQERKYDVAIPLLREVITRFPDDIESRFQLGLALGLSNRPLDARLELMQVIDLDSTRADALEHLGMLAFGAEDRPEAIEMLERAVKMGAQKVQLWLDVACAALAPSKRQVRLGRGTDSATSCRQSALHLSTVIYLCTRM